MTQEEYMKFAEETFAEMLELIKAKNTDYTAGGDAFANFNAAADYGVDPIVGLAVRMGDKTKRVQSFCKNGKLEVVGEGIEDAFKDHIGYSVIALGMLHERKIAKIHADRETVCYDGQDCEPGRRYVLVEDYAEVVGRKLDEKDDLCTNNACNHSGASPD